MGIRYQSVDDTRLGDAKAFTTRINLTSVSTFLLDDTNQWQFEIQPNILLPSTTVIITLLSLSITLQLLPIRKGLI
jgi:hypothetical protein